MRLPRDLTGRTLATLLARYYDYVLVRQSGSHLRLSTQREGLHHVTIPTGGPLRVGTLAAILNEVADHFGISRADLEDRLFN